MSDFSGAWPALVTPFTPKDKVNVTVLRELVDYLIDKQVGGFYVCGGTGEGLFMSPEERTQLPFNEERRGEFQTKLEAIDFFTVADM